ncbi:MAG TPA: S26 family signal peptidase [Nitrosospira sp.]|nr:S26 family signal peptidase [Nitrosospira sp.]
MTRAIGFATLTILALLAIGRAIGLNVNLTESAPEGIWITQPANSIARGILVAVCPPSEPVVTLLRDRGHLRYGDCQDTEVQPLLKAVAATSGDTVLLREGFPAIVNGKELPNTTAQARIPRWPDGEYKVSPNEIWIFSTYSEKSFDSRYFGPVPINNVREKAAPVLVNGPAENMTRGIQ